MSGDTGRIINGLRIECFRITRHAKEQENEKYLIAGRAHISAKQWLSL
jgi:hypothetical protein